MADGQTNLGSFGTGIPGGVDAIRQALQRRGMGETTPALNQMSGGAPTAIPPTQPMGGSAVPQEIQTQPPAGPSSPGVTSTEAEIIVKGLINRLGAISKAEAPPKAASSLGGM